MPAYRRRMPGCTNQSPGMSSWKLPNHPRFDGVSGPVVACVLDGVGIGAHDESDAVWLARTPNLDWLARHALATLAVRARHGRGHAERRRHGQQRGRAQRARRGPHLRPGREAGRRRDRRRAAVPRRGLAAARRARARIAPAAALHRAALGRQRPQPHRPPVRDAAPLRRGRRARGARARAARRPRRARAQRARLRRRARRAARDAAPPRRSRLPDRVGRRPHARDDGPLPGRLADRRARLEHPRARRSARVLAARARRSRRSTARIRRSTTSISRRS